ncbi:hypothetical protein JK207_07710 [Gluconobacter cerinus]|uniref:hypothetical protein n=1 Tax=Gluconobacter cerinus TaxID=38307 RepID=UPI001B8BC1AE|nr:hypothetical protein [Gluconobacter cerinus]MBS1021917.1 hypothetical protein [Gluconobacter cerinus]
MTPITKEQAIARLPRVPTGWIYPADANIPVFEALVNEGIASRKGFGFQLKETKP